MGLLNSSGRRPHETLTSDPIEQFDLRILKLENRLQRERAARLEAEAIAEKGLRDLYEKQQQLALLERIATKANQSTAVDETLRFAVHEICRYTHWSFGDVYKLAASGVARLVPTPIWWAADAAELTRFIAISQATEFLPGIGLPGRVLSSGNAAWVSDVTLDPNFPRAPVALACGLRAGFAFRS